MSLPETTEETWYGTPAYKVKGKGFLRFRTESDGGLVVFVSSPDEAVALLESSSKKFFTTPHYEGHATVLVRLEAIGVRELLDLVTESWRMKAPPKVRAAFDAGDPSSG